MKNRIVIVMDGGLVQSIIADRPSEVDIAVVDYDTDGAYDFELSMVPQGFGREEPAYVCRFEAEDSDIGVDDVFRLLRET